jgi:hypothetical protein
MGKTRYNTLQPSPEGTKYKLAVIEFVVPGKKNGGSDKGPDGHRVDSIPIANSIIEAGAACDLVRYEFDKHDEFVSKIFEYDAVLVRINPGQLSQGTTPGTQGRFDSTMMSLLAAGKLVWSSPAVQTNMGAKDALVKCKDMSCGLPDTFAYYTAAELDKGFKLSMAFQPRVVKQNRGSAGEGIWLCWLEGKDYCAKLGDSVLGDDDKVKLMEMNDNHVEYHTVKEFVTFCVGGPDAPGAGAQRDMHFDLFCAFPLAAQPCHAMPLVSREPPSPQFSSTLTHPATRPPPHPPPLPAGEWKSTFPGKYLEGGKAAGGQLVDQRLLPRISEGEVRMLMVGPNLQMMVHKKPEGGGLSAVGGNSAYTFYKPGDPHLAELEEKFVKHDIPQLKKALEIENDPLPILWTGDFIPADAEGGKTQYILGEFNCSCVGISKFQAVCGGDKTLADISDEDYFDGVELTDLMGVTAIQMLDENTSKKTIVDVDTAAGRQSVTEAAKGEGMSKDEPIFVIGEKAAHAARTMMDAGYKNVIALTEDLSEMVKKAIAGKK